MIKFHLLFQLQLCTGYRRSLKKTYSENSGEKKMLNRYIINPIINVNLHFFVLQEKLIALCRGNVFFVCPSFLSTGGFFSRYRVLR